MELFNLEIRYTPYLKYDKRLEKLDFETRLQAMLNALQAEYLHRPFTNQELKGLGISRHKTNPIYRWMVYMDNQEIQLRGDLKQEEDCFTLTTMYLVKKNPSEKEDDKENDSPSEKAEENEFSSDKTEEQAVVENESEAPVVSVSKAGPTFLRVWLLVRQSKDRFFNSRKNPMPLLTEFDYRDLNASNTTYPVLFQNREQIEVQFEDGNGDTFQTEFCARVYAVIGKNISTSAMQSLRELDKEGQKVNEKLRIFVREQMEASVEEDLALLDCFHMKVIESAEKDQIKKESHDNNEEAQDHEPSENIVSVQSKEKQKNKFPFWK